MQVRGLQPPSRRQMLKRFANGFGMLGFASLLANDVLADAVHPLLARSAPFAAKAKRVIFLFMSGGPSHVDLFDPKPKLADYAGKPLPFEQPRLVRTRTVNVLPSSFKFAKHGQCG